MTTPRLILACLSGFAGAVLAHSSDAQTPLKMTRIIGGFERPVAMAYPPGDHRRKFFVEANGTIAILVDDRFILPTKFLDIRGQVARTNGEQGLLGLAFHPDYDTNGWFYIYYTQISNGASVVERYTVSADPDVADPTSAVTILGPIAQPGPSHNCGTLRFGPDDKLYVAVGDGGMAGCTAQDGNSLLGKILRLNDDGSIPPTNPFVGIPGMRNEIWVWGLRNQWGFTFDRVTGDMWIPDVGADAREEINFVPAGTSGQNFGWERKEGSLCHATSTCLPSVPGCASPIYTDPVHDYAHTPDPCSGSVTGGYVYRGCAIPDLVDTYFFADWCTTEIHSFRYDGAALTELTDRTSVLNPGMNMSFMTAFGEGSGGELYIIEQFGEVWKLEPNVTPAYVDLGFALAGTLGEPLLDVCGALGAGDTATLRLRDANPSSASGWMLSGAQNPFPVIGGTLVPDITALFAIGVATDANGEFNVPLITGIGPLTLYFQFLTLDPNTPGGASFSNAIEVNWP